MKLLLPLFLLMFFNKFEEKKEYDLERIVVCGNVIDLSSNTPIKHRPIYFSERPFIYGTPEEYDDFDKSNSKGNFSLITWIDKSEPTLYLYLEEYASISFVDCSVEKSNGLDTINLGNIYLVKYDNEMIEERYNMPEIGKSENLGLMKISEIDSLLNLNPEMYNMSMKIDTTENMITRYNFGPEKPRGTTIQSYKTVAFVRNMRTQN